MYVIMLFPFSIKFYVWVSSELLFELCLLFSGMQDCLYDLELFWTFWSQALSVFVFQNFAFDYFTSGFADFWITMSLLFFFFFAWNQANYWKSHVFWAATKILMPSSLLLSTICMCTHQSGGFCAFLFVSLQSRSFTQLSCGVLICSALLSWWSNRTCRTKDSCFETALFGFCGSCPHLELRWILNHHLLHLPRIYLSCLVSGIHCSHKAGWWNTSYEMRSQ